MRFLRESFRCSEVTTTAGKRNMTWLYFDVDIAVYSVNVFGRCFREAPLHA